MHRTKRAAWQLKQGDLLITAGTYEDFPHPQEVGEAAERGPDVRVDFTTGVQSVTFSRGAEVFIVDTFRSPNVTATTKECADCSGAVPVDSIHTECRRCRTRPFG